MADQAGPGPVIQGVIVPRDVGPIEPSEAFSNSDDQQQRRTYSRHKFDAVKKNAYVSLIRRGMRRVRSAEYVGVGYKTVLRHMELDPEFAEAVSEAEMVRIDEVEQALFETALTGNVVAQQVVLYNRRSDEWADQRQIKARLEAAKAEADAREDRDERSSLDGLRQKLSELRERITPTAAEMTPEAAAEPVTDND